MANHNPRSLTRERNLILIVLIGLASAAWIALIRQSVATEKMGLTMGMSGPVFVVFWVTMMVAMMFPAAAPMVLTFARVQANKRAQLQAFVPTWIFVGGYLVVWALPGVLAWVVARWTENAAAQS